MNNFNGITVSMTRATRATESSIIVKVNFVCVGQLFY